MSCVQGNVTPRRVASICHVCVTVCASFAARVAAVNARRTSRWQTVLGAVLVIALISWVALGILEANHYRKLIPRELQVLEPVLIDSNANIDTLIGAILIRPELCGAAIFRLSPATLQQIERDGLAFFEKVNGAGPGGAPQAYRGWQSGPLPHDWTRNGLWSGLLCTDLSPGMVKQLNAAAAEPDAFYTHSVGGGNELVVLPNPGWVVFTYWD
jgi:hypothetical protein